MPAPKRKKTLISDSESEGSASEGEDDLDKELLTLAKKKKTNGGKAESGNSSSDSDTSSGSDDEWTGKSGKKKVKKKKKRSSPPPPNKPDASSSEEEGGNNSEPEEGEVNDSESEKSGSDSDSDAGSDKSEEFNDGYDEDLMGDEEDRRRLEQMTEKEREQELFNRIEQREVLKTRFEIERKLKKAKEKEQKRKEKKEGKKEKSSSIASSPVRAAESSNQRLKEVEARRGTSTKMQKLNELKLQREKKKQDQEDREKQRREEEEKRQETKSKKKKKNKLQTNEVFSSSDESDKASSKSGDEEDAASGKASASPKRRSRSRSSSSSSSSSNSSRSGSKSPSRSTGSGGSDAEVERENTKPKVITTKEELGRIRLSRFKLERWVHAPFFGDTVLNCFVRVNIGTNQGQAIYRVTEIVGVKETQKVYDFGTSKTNKALRLRYAKAERDYRLEYISNSDFTQHEYNKWIEAMTVADLPLPTLKEVEKKQKSIKEAVAFKFNDDSISKMVEEKEKFRKNPINYAMRKTRLQKLLEIAQTGGEAEKAEELKSQLDELEERAAELDRQRTKNISSVTYINERNRVNNIKVVEQAMVKEFRIQKMQAADPFMRKNTAPTMVTMAKDSDGKVMKDHLFQFLEERYSAEKPKWVRDKEQQKEAASAISSALESPAKDVAGPRVNSTGGGGSRNEDLFSCHDFDVNIDLNVPSSLTPTPSSAARPSLTPGGSAGPKRTLNLEDYKRKKGLI